MPFRQGSWIGSCPARGIPHVAREEFRHVSYIRLACVATIKGHGLEGYLEALRLLASGEYEMH